MVQTIIGFWFPNIHLLFTTFILNIVSKEIFSTPYSFCPHKPDSEERDRMKADYCK